MNNKSRERVEHIIAVQTAWKEGKQIEQSLKGKDDWRDKYTPFDWAVYDYRIKPEYKTMEEGAENYITQIEEMDRHSAQIINPSTDFTEFKKIWNESDVWNAFIAGARMQRDIDLHKAKNTIQEWLEDEGFCYDESIFINLQKSIMED